jgi:type III pantothenate kinase
VSVLLVDIGNTRIKWARLRGEAPGRQRAAGHAGWSSAQYRRALFAGAARVTAVVAVSVASTRVEQRFMAAVRAATGRPPQFIRTSRRAGGVTNGYRAAWRLGADRWVALIGAHAAHRPPRATCVVDVGTALTIDLVDARGVHAGGAIVPGPRLMVASLLAGTSGIGHRAGPAALRQRAGRKPRSLFATGTRQGLEAGARHAVAAAIDRAAVLAQQRVGARAPLELVLTGGAAPAVASLVTTPHRVMPDLVLRGLAVLCRLGART